MTVKREMTPEMIEEVARVFRALSVPSRLHILHSLKSGEQHVGGLVESLGLTQANVSKHLRVLKETGLVVDRQEGSRVFYSHAGPFVYELCEVVCEGIAPMLVERARRFAAFGAASS